MRRTLIRPVTRRSFLAAASCGVGAMALPEHSRAGIDRHPNERGGVQAVLLGSAQDGGVPHAGCRCSHCEAARRNRGLRRRSPCLAVLDYAERKVFVFDAGPDFDEQIYALPAQWRKGRNPVDAIFLTHAHVGHYTGLMYLGRAVMSTEALPVYCSGRMESFLRDNGPWSLLTELNNIEIQKSEPGRQVRLTARVGVSALAVPHRAEFTDTFAYLIQGPQRRMLFLPDIDRWEELSPPIEELVRSVDIALLDGTFYSADELPGRDMSRIPHPPVAETMDRLQGVANSGGTRIVFIHLNHSSLLLDAEGEHFAAACNRGFEVGFDGKSFEL